MLQRAAVDTCFAFFLCVIVQEEEDPFGLDSFLLGAKNASNKDGRPDDSL